MKYIYWTSTGIVCLLMLYSAGMYLTNYEAVKGFFEHFGYPTYIIYPLAVLKLLGVVVILWRKHRSLTEWAYAGFFFDFVLAVAAHYTTDGNVQLSLFALLLLLTSYFTDKYVRPV